jgi:hypothetical protein
LSVCRAVRNESKEGVDTLCLGTGLKFPDPFVEVDGNELGVASEAGCDGHCWHRGDRDPEGIFLEKDQVRVKLGINLI